MKLLELKSVFKKYGDQHVLNGISISFENGKIYLIKGRSGCGKSTLLNICSLLENPDRGEVFYKGTETKKLSENERKEILRGHIGYIFQDYNLFEELSVYHNLQIYLLSITRKSIAEMDKTTQRTVPCVLYLFALKFWPLIDGNRSVRQAAVDAAAGVDGDGTTPIRFYGDRSYTGRAWK